MIRHEQTLRLVRLVILKSGSALYDEVFHPGVNIIRGDNGSGKSTIADFLFFVLGGTPTEFTPEALSADSVHAQVMLSGKEFTLSRDVDDQFRSPMFFYEGDYAAAMQNRDIWRRYPQVRSANVESFSQLIFRLLHLPEQTTDAKENVTVHQLLRLIYCDQMTSVDKIFRRERHDTADMRKAISEFLLGFDDLEPHKLRLAMRANDRKLGELVGELRSIFGVLGKTAESGITVIDFDDEAKKLQQERDEAASLAVTLTARQETAVNRDAANQQLGAISKQLKEVNADLIANRQTEERLTFEIEDSEKFVETLRERMEALDAAKSMADVLGAAEFAACPACLTPIRANGKENVCQLCKADLPVSALGSGHLKMREELAFQIRESSQLLELRRGELGQARTRIVTDAVLQKRLLAELDEFKRRSDPIDAEIANTLKRVGYLDRMIEDMARKAELASVVKARQDERDEVQQQLNALKTRLEALEAASKKRRESVELRISQLASEALLSDVPTEEEFQAPELVVADFERDRMTVNGRSKYSASSQTYLKNSVLFSLFRLSLEDEQTRWPRFIILDNVEDKGMQPQRSHHFQEFVVSALSDSPVDHQVILTTSMISPRLEGSDLCVGEHYTKQRKTLRFAQKS